MKRIAVIVTVTLIVAGWIVAATRVPVREHAPASPTVVAESTQIERPRPSRPRHPARVTVERFLDAFTRYEVGGGGRQSRITLRRTATPHLAGELLRRPPRVPRGVPRAQVNRIVIGRIRRGRVTAIASLARVGRVTTLVIVVGRRGRRWRVAEVRR